jgi:UDP-N-acetylglucosamine 2-epimerase
LEINRVVMDRLADLLLTPSRDANAQLRVEGEPDREIVFVGNLMIDNLFYALPTARATGFRQKLGVNALAVEHAFAVVPDSGGLQEAGERVIAALVNR